MRELLEALAIGVLVILVVICICVGLIHMYEKGICDQAAAVNDGYSFNYRFMGTCLVEIQPGLWLPYSDVAYMFAELQGE